MHNKVELPIDLTEEEYQAIAAKAAELGITADEFVEQALTSLVKDIRDGNLPTP